MTILLSTILFLSLIAVFFLGHYSGYKWKEENPSKNYIEYFVEDEVIDY